MTGNDVTNKLDFFSTGDFEKIKTHLWNMQGQGCENCLLGLYVWKNNYDFELLEFDNGAVLHSKKDDSFIFPYAKTEKEQIEIINVLKSKKKNLKIKRLTQNQKKLLEKTFQSKITFEEDRGSFDYIYDVQSLANLSGSKMSKKRNHINGFLNLYKNWHVEEITCENLSEIAAFAEKWYEKRIGGDSEIGNSSLDEEKKALFTVLPLLEYFQAEGLLLKVDNQIVAFSIGQRISEEVYDVVFEKGSEEIRGSYNMINREFVRFVSRKYSDVKYINRENDLNLPGLRKAKLSYMPAFLLEKFTCCFSS